MKYSFFHLLCFSLLFTPLAAQETKKAVAMGSLEGRITDQSGAEVDLVTLTIENKLFQRTITVDQSFIMDAIPGGSYRLTATALGYAVLETNVEILPNQENNLDIQLQAQSISLSQVVVAPSTFSIMQKSPEAVNYLDRDAIRNTPHLSDDVYRTVDNLPGASGNDVSASFNIRGGDYREVSVTLDGMELYEPFHIKDFTGIFSIVDAEIIGGLDLVAGGYSAEAGNAMSGLLKMESVDPVEKKSSVGISFSTAHYQTEGTFAQGLGSYVFSARRGWLDILLGLADEDSEEEQEETSIAYWDSFGKITYTLKPNQKLGLHFLLSGDDFEETSTEDGEIENANNSFSNNYVWLNLDSYWSDRLSSRSTLFLSQFDEKQDQDSFEVSETVDFENDQDFEYMGFKQDWTYDLNGSQFWRVGFQWKTGEADYAYTALTQFENPLVGPSVERQDFALTKDGDMLSAYVTGRFRLVENLISEIGVRYDDQDYLDDDQISPRVNLAWQISDKQTLRFAFGDYHQAQRLHELAVEDGETDYFQTAERARHYTIGYEQRFKNGMDFRIEAYRKDIKDPRPYYINLFEVINITPALADDRYAVVPQSAEITGAEISLKQDLGGRLSWFVNYAWSKAEDEINGQMVARQWDQEHTFNASVNYRYNRRWNFNGSWNYHTGWRITPFTFTNDASAENGYRFDLGPINSDKLNAYHRLDLRVNRSIYRANGRSFNLYIDVQNLYNRKNLAGFEDLEVINNNGVNELVYDQAKWLPILPSLGVNWVF